MISNIHIENYKSIIDLPLDLGRVNVFIGENGAGKSNILEAIALAGAAAANKLDNEFLASRGVRVVRPIDVRPAFAGRDPKMATSVSVSATNGGNIGYSIENDNHTYAKWRAMALPKKSLEGADLFETLKSAVKSVRPKSREVVEDDHPNEGSATTNLKVSLDDLMLVIDSIREQLEPIVKEVKQEKLQEPRSIHLTRSQGDVLNRALLTTHDRQTQLELSEFVTFSPENSVLRAHNAEAQIEPLGVKGEGVSKLFSFYVNQATGGDNIAEGAARSAKSVLESLDRSLRMLGWFDGLRVGRERQEDLLEVRDFYVEEEDRHFELASANEGFFFLLFYFLLFSSDLTPPFFAIDNVDTSLNPALCRALTTELVNLATKHNKQAILTTHNPAILDGLNLDDDEQRLFVVSRNMDGETRVERIKKPKSFEGLPNLKMSEAFMRGLIGGLSTKF